MTKFSILKKMGVLLTLAVVFTVASSAIAQTAADPNARARAAAARSQANRAEGTAVTAKATADQAKADAAAADLKATQAKADAVALGTRLGGEIQTKEGQLRNAIGAARGAAVAGDRRLEKEFKATAESLQKEIDELKKKAQHTCAAFTDPTTQKDCLKSIELMHVDDNKVASQKITADADVAKAEITAKTAGTQAVFDFGKEQLDAVKALETGCLPTTSTANGATQVTPKCPDKMRKGGVMAYQFDHIGGANGIHSMTIKPAESKTASKWGKILGVGVLGGAAGAGLGYAFFPNHETLPDGSTIDRPNTGLIGGAALGFAVTAAVTWAIEELTE